jgi:hypothetical protein
VTRLSRIVRNAHLLVENATTAYDFSRPTLATLHGLYCRDLCPPTLALRLWKVCRQTPRNSRQYCRLQAPKTDAHLTTS